MKSLSKTCCCLNECAVRLAGRSPLVIKCRRSSPSTPTYYSLESNRCSTPCTFAKSVRAKIIVVWNLISDPLPFGRLWYGEPNAISNAKFRNRSHDAVIRVYDEAGNTDFESAR